MLDHSTTCRSSNQTQSPTAISVVVPGDRIDLHTGVGAGIYEQTCTFTTPEGTVVQHMEMKKECGTKYPALACTIIIIITGSYLAHFHTVQCAI